MEWLLWHERHLRHEEWSALMEQEIEDHDAMARAYPDYAANHHPLWRNHLEHARNVGEHRVPGSRYSLDG